MGDPFLITGPALISFSGGRTSAYMLWRILRAHGGTLPADVAVAFANTGKEREETLRFVHECATRWGVEIAWLEWRDKKREYERKELAVEETFEVVGYNSASRNGEPFATLLNKKTATPNWQARWCTMYLKVEVLHAYAAAIGFAPGYKEVVGLRHDEGSRLLKMYARNAERGRNCVAPLDKGKVTRRDVMAFWAAQPFDLQLKPYEGNCDLCFMKGRGIRKTLIRENPGMADWWVEQERLTGGFFDRRDRYADLVREVSAQPHLFDSADDEHDAECGLWCAGEAA